MSGPSATDHDDGSGMIRVVLADDQELIRAGFRVLIDTAPDLSVVGEASDGRSAIELLRSQRADVVLMDIRMPGLDGLAATREISSDTDLAGVRVIMSSLPSTSTTTSSGRSRPEPAGSWTRA